jgi:hypothetical protein
LGACVKFAVVVSVRWSVSIQVPALRSIVQSLLWNCFTIKEAVMNMLHAIVLFGATLLPVPEGLAKVGLAAAPFAQRFGNVRDSSLPKTESIRVDSLSRHFHQQARSY